MTLPLPLASRFLGLVMHEHNPSIFGGRLPDALAGLPLPEETTVAVSCLSQTQQDSFLVVAALDTPLPTELFMSQASALLERDGWQREEPEPYRPLFSEPAKLQFYPTSWTTPLFNKGDLQLTLEPTDEDAANGLTPVQLRVERHPGVEPPKTATGGLLDLLPRLQLPEEAVFHGGGGHWGPHHAAGEANVSPSLPSGQLAGYVVAQLEATGWRVTERLVGERAALILLDRRDESDVYDARVSVLNVPGSDLSQVSVEVIKRVKRESR